MNQLFTILALLLFCISNAQDIAVLKYNGGGDWYSNPTALPNLVKFCNSEIDTAISEKTAVVEVGSTDLFQFPFVHMTGHGNVVFNSGEALNLRNYLNSGGFLHIDDNYGMLPYVTKALKDVYPNQELVELPANHPIFTSVFNFTKGLPKIHEHDGKRPQAFGLFHKGRLVVLLTVESDLGDGWEDPEVHNDPENIRLKALQMGANIVKYVFGN
ncbi:DUF4159 domain-containing protein [Aurantibacter sp.]|uniref:DUF4159 domain-containing protein n=1 Tax=Aurantibacter sp. TaxID=2807103 RepID=UPI0035C7FB5E